MHKTREALRQSVDLFVVIGLVFALATAWEKTFGREDVPKEIKTEQKVEKE